MADEERPTQEWNDQAEDDHPRAERLFGFLQSGTRVGAIGRCKPLVEVASDRSIKPQLVGNLYTLNGHPFLLKAVPRAPREGTELVILFRGH